MPESAVTELLDMAEAQGWHMRLRRERERFRQSRMDVSQGRAVPLTAQDCRLVLELIDTALVEPEHS